MQTSGRMLIVSRSGTPLMTQPQFSVSGRSLGSRTARGCILLKTLKCFRSQELSDRGKTF